MSGSRMTHIKSRNGCSQCKQKRKKCDQHPPCCGRCLKLGIQCDYQELFKPGLPAAECLQSGHRQGLSYSFVIDPRFVRRSGSVKSNSIQKSACEKTPQKRPTTSSLISLDLCHIVPGLQCRDIELLHHYFTITCLTITPIANRQLFWRTIVKMQARSCVYVKHTVLALSALHLASICPGKSEESLRIATAHQFTAISLFRQEVKRVIVANQAAVVTFSTLLILNESALMSQFYNSYDTESDPINRLLHRFLLIQRTKSLLKSIPKFAGSSFVKNLQNTLLSPEIHKIPPEVASALQLLDDLNLSTTVNLIERRIYSQALCVLHKNYFLMLRKTSEWTTALFWGANISGEYIRLLVAKRPMALLVLAHYCVLLHHAPTRWWMSRWSGLILDVVNQSLDEPWRMYLSWPMRAVQPDQAPLFKTSHEPEDNSFVVDAADLIHEMVSDPHQHCSVGKDRRAIIQTALE